MTPKGFGELNSKKSIWANGKDLLKKKKDGD